ncbi:MAG: bifunctional tRNA (5-methylaminomethyl-2-thiouridine)(34)-methyltransferase MnmD/FAD-dependent 5-carboxymethylaminomethyl-2-thiouridine(34) oxidoreductase MnmC [Burkholderiaceae bacterium]|nr:bifunctional tRNA (5-methylaminomethyl-2-thiouridine)(34)-methyltransferase MnmD/FAD-dependent 5-carboxymethylaminomethyl-2-thiouridine(34) oxidoreductase MnmC [Burkholderiaceae bacterium]
MTVPRASVAPVVLAWRDGVPYSTDYEDVYASRDGALGQARHVFLGGNELPARWQGRDQFVILETGFGLGTNFLATLHAWRADAQPPRRLHVVSIELHPVRAADLVAAAPAELQALAAELAAQWPLPLPGLHRLEFDGGDVTLTLALGDARALLPQLVLGADAIYLDGFAPERNPALWEAPLLKAVARLARPGATLATYTAARAVREALAAAGFEVTLRPGFGRKRHMLAARYAPRWRVRRHEPPARYDGKRDAIVIGAGLAGAHCADALARRGWQVTVVDAQPAPAQGASGLPWGLLHPLVSADDNLTARLTRAGFLRALQRLAALDTPVRESLWQLCGVAQQAGSDEEALAWQAVSMSDAWPTKFARVESAAALATYLGLAPRRGGWWFPQGGVVAAGAWSRRLLSAEGIARVGGVRIERLAQVGGQWQALDADGAVRASAPVVVLANALDAPRLLGSRWLTVQAVRGRISYLRAPVLRALRAGLTGDGYLVHAPDGSLGVGASYELALPGAAEAGALAAEQVHHGNLERLARLLGAPVAAEVIGVFDGVRCVAPDRLPYAGAVADDPAAAAEAARLRGAHAIDLPRRAGLYTCCALGSRGLALSAVLGELIAAQIEGEPWPLERALADAVDPGRRLLWALRTGRAGAGAAAAGGSG